MTSQVGNPFFMLCDKTAVRELIDPNRHLITLRDHIPLIDALKLLTSSHISSCPVIDAAGQCIGSVDFLSLLKYVTVQSAKDDPVDIYTTPIKNVIQHCSKLVPYFIENPISQLIDIMTKTHRIAVFKKDFELCTTLSQSDVVRYLIKILDDIKADEAYTRRYAADIEKLCDKKLSELALFHTPVSLPSSATLFEAIELCTSKNYRVLSVVNDNGQIIGDFCVEKLSALQDSFHNVRTLTLLDWLTTINPTKPSDVPCINADASYRQAIYLMISCKSHHLWVIGEDAKPLLVVTMTDLLRVLQTSEVDLNKVSDGLDLHKLWK